MIIEVVLKVDVIAAPLSVIIVSDEEEQLDEIEELYAVGAV